MPDIEHGNAENELSNAEKTTTGIGNNLYNKTLDLVSNNKDKIKDAAKNGTKKAINNLKEKVDKEGTQKFIESLVASGIKTAVLSYILPVIIILLILAIIPFGIMSVISLMSGRNVELELPTEKVQVAVTEAYKDIQDSSKTMLLNHIKSNYGCKNFDGSDPTLANFTAFDNGINGNGYYFESDTCRVTITYTPDLETVAKSASAYASAIDGAIAYYEDDASKYDKYISYRYDEYLDREVPTYDWSKYFDPNSSRQVLKEGEVEDSTFVDPIDGTKYSSSTLELSGELLRDLKEVFEASSETSVNSEDFANQIKNYSNEYFMLEERPDNWDVNMQFKKAYFKETKYRTVYYCDYSDGHSEKGACKLADTLTLKASVRTEEEPYYVYHDGYIGNIEVPIYFDFTSYKADEIENIKTKLVRKGGRCLWEYDEETNELTSEENCTKFEANRVVEDTIYNYFSTTLQMYGVDNFDYYGGNMYSYKGFSGVVSYSGDFDYGAYKGVYAPNSPVGQKFWGHVKYLKDNKEIWGSANGYWCTTFAQTWIYDVWGINSSKNNSGSGAQFASVLIASRPDMFVYSNSPAPGGIVSIHSGGDGHVVCVDAVDYEAGTITYSHCWGLYGKYKGEIELHKTISLKEFYQTWGKMTFANPIQEQ